MTSKASDLIEELRATNLDKTHAVSLILAFADEIRRECKDKALGSCYMYANGRAFVHIDVLTAAIMGKEAGE